MSDKLSKILTVLALLGLVVGLGGCKDNGGNPHSTYTYNSIFSNQPVPDAAPPSPAPPPATADMAPGPWPDRPGCRLNLYPEGSGIFQPDNFTVQPRWDVRCTVKVVVFLLTARVQKWNGRDWDDELPIHTEITPPIPYVPDDSPESLQTNCFPGVWRIVIDWSGADALGGHFGDHRVGQEVTLTCT